jgi:GntR family transcriptional regulator
MLNRSDVVPLYVQLERILREEILSGKYKEGEMIPSETQLMKAFDVTRTTIRKAISDLVHEGLLKQVHGKGTFVNLREIKHNIWNFSGFTDYISKKNETPVSELLEKSFVVHNKKRFMKLVRVRGVKKESGTLWLTIDSSLVPLSVFPGIDQYDFAQASLYNIMHQTYNKVPRNASLTIHPIMGDARTKQQLGYENDIPLLKAVGSVYDENNVELEQVEVIYGPQMEFKVVTNI